VFHVNETQLIKLTPDTSLMTKIRNKSKNDKEIQEVVGKLWGGQPEIVRFPWGYVRKRMAYSYMKD
jgi:hypothetical protein